MDTIIKQEHFEEDLETYDEGKNYPSNGVVQSDLEDDEIDIDPFVNVKCELADGDDEFDSSESCTLEPITELVLFENEIPENPNKIVSNTRYSNPLDFLQQSLEEQTDLPSSSYSNSLEFECKLCLEKLSSQPELEFHVGTCVLYTKDKDRYCVSCNKKFNRPEALKIHSLSFHGTDEEKSTLYKFECSVCHKKYREKHRLKIHMESHKSKEEQVKPFKCEICEESFIDRGSLSEHLRTHSDDRPFKCSQLNCGKAYKFRKNLRDHMEAAHSDSKRFTCPKAPCEKTFSFRTSLCKHMAAEHSEAKSLICEQPNCGKIFGNRRTFNNHVRSHSVKLSYKCNEGTCEKAFESLSKLYRHKAQSHST